MTEKIRVVIDPNLIASTLLGGITRDHFLLLVGFADQIDICYSDELLEEVHALPDHAYFRGKGITETVVADFLSSFIRLAVKVFVTSDVKIGRDKNDFYLLSLCRDARADYLLTGDPDLLILEKYGQTHIIRFSAFVDTLKVL